MSGGPSPLPISRIASIAVLAGAGAGAWIGIADGLRALCEAPRPFTAEDFKAAVLAHACGGAALGLFLVPAAFLFSRRGAAALWTPVHAAAFLYLALLGRFLLLRPWNPTETRAGNLAVKGAILAAAVAGAWLLLRFHLRRASEPAGVPRALPAALVLPLLVALGAGYGDSSPLPTREPGFVREATGIPPNVLVVLVDTLRADRVGACGGTRGLTPRIDAFAREGTAFRTARTSSPWTLPAVASVFTGLRPDHHGTFHATRSLPPDLPSLPAILETAGYRVALLSDSHWVSPEFGFGRGVRGPHLVPEAGGLRGTVAWKTWADLVDRWTGADRSPVTAHQASLRGAPALNRLLFRWMDDGGGVPWAAYVHWMEPHAPYAPRRPTEPGRPRVGLRFFDGLAPLDRQPPFPPADFEALVANYDDEVREVDAAFGDLVDGLRSRGVLEDTLVVFLADHGEEFHEHGGFAHGQGLMEEVLRIPLIARFPGGSGRGRTVDAPVRIEDVLPTILEVSGIRTIAPMDGKSLVPFAGAGEEDERRTLAMLWKRHSGARCLVEGGKKVMALDREGERTVLLYDLVEDLGETRDIYRSGDPLHGNLLRELLGALPTWTSGLPPSPAATGARVREALQGVGYLGGEEGR